MQAVTPVSPRGIERRIRQHLYAQTQALFAVCTPGFENQCKAEIAALSGATVTGTETGGVSFEGPFELIYLANLRLRTALRILLRVDEFGAGSYPELFNKCRRVSWERYLGDSQPYAIKVSSRHSRLHHTDNIARAVADAITPSLNSLGMSATHDDTAEQALYVRLSRDRCTLSIDTSGTLLHKRGYRSHAGVAPLRETTAAALLMQHDLLSYERIVDPFCGSGTFLIEAAFILCNKQPGAARHFAFEHYPWFGDKTWQHLLKQAGVTVAVPAACPELIGGDIDQSAVTLATACADHAPCPISIACSDSRDGAFFLPVKGLLCANLPYGKRAGEAASIDLLYRQFGECVRKQAQGWDYTLIVPDTPVAWDLLGLKPISIVRFSNGGLAVAAGSGTV